MRTIRRAIETDRVSHAYLFSGPRGTGKTSTAKVLAMGLNCEKGPTPEPDGTCASCRAIVGNSSMDVLEMDAASNRGIDEIRDLRDKVNLAPAAGRMRVYIIDEVHMLTTEAFNALLKMLEEPPEHVVFVLATTEKHKVLPTIISRCQSFDFRRPSIETLTEKLAEISEAEGIEVEPEALTVIAREGRGSFRDAEGLLDQLSSFSEGRITASMVRELLGGVGPEALIETTYALSERRAADALRVVDRLSNEGKDLGQFVVELLAHLRNLMLLPHAPEVALAGVGAEERAPLEEQANAVPTAEVVRLVDALGDSLSRIRRGGDPKLELELTFLKLTRDYTEPDLDALLSRLETLEKAVENGSVADEPHDLRTNTTETTREAPQSVEREPAQEARSRSAAARFRFGKSPMTDGDRGGPCLGVGWDHGRAQAPQAGAHGRGLRRGAGRGLRRQGPAARLPRGAELPRRDGEGAGTPRKTGRGPRRATRVEAAPRSQGRGRRSAPPGRRTTAPTERSAPEPRPASKNPRPRREVRTGRPAGRQTRPRP